MEGKAGQFGKRTHGATQRMMQIKRGLMLAVLSAALTFTLGGCADQPPAGEGGSKGASNGDGGGGDGQGNSNGVSNGVSNGTTGGSGTSNGTLGGASNGTSNGTVSNGTSNGTTGPMASNGTSNGTTVSNGTMGTSNGTTGNTSNGTGGTTGNTTVISDDYCIDSAEEPCDGLDNNCNGQVDEGCTCGQFADQPCYAGNPQTINVGICRQGIQECDNGGEFFDDSCEGQTLAEVELCDVIDNDCDGQIDENWNVGDSCSTGSGDCSSQGVWACSADGTGVECTAVAVEPGDELCDRVDNDCDSSVDEEFTTLGEACSVGVGACQNSGVEECTADGSGTICSAQPFAPTDERCDGIDNNCNEAIDEDFPELGEACSVGEGVCAATGTWVCAEDGLGVACDATPLDAASEEICDEIDNDCDGEVDELPECDNHPPDVVCQDEISASTLDTATITAAATDIDGDSMTYRWEMVSQPIGSTSAATPLNQLTTNLWLDIAGDFVLRFTATDEHGASSDCQTIVHSVPSEQFRVELLWNIGAASDDSDVDLHLLHTGRSGNWGVTSTDGADCHWRNCDGGSNLEWGAPGDADNPRLDVDDVEGFGPENINIDDPEDATYRIGVHYWSADSFGDSTVVLRIYCNAQLIREFEPVTLRDNGDTATNDFWVAADVVWNGPICTVNEFGTPGNRTIGPGTSF